MSELKPWTILRKIESVGIYCESQLDADFIADILGIKPLNDWASSRRAGKIKRKVLVKLGQNWKFIGIPKDDIIDHYRVSDVMDWIKSLARYGDIRDLDTRHDTTEGEG